MMRTCIYGMVALVLMLSSASASFFLTQDLGVASTILDPHEKVPAFKDVTMDWKDYECSETAAIEVNGVLYITWQGKSSNPDGGSRGAIYLRTYDDRGEKPIWGPIHYVTDVSKSKDRFGHANDYQKVVYMDGKLYIIFESEDDTQKPSDWKYTNQDILIRSFDINTSKFGDIVIVNDENASDARDIHPDAIVYNDRIYIVWERNYNSTRSELCMRIYDGNTFSDLTIISSGDEGVFNGWPDLCIYRNRLYVIWEKMDTNEGVTYVLCSEIGGEPMTISTIRTKNFKDLFPKIEVYQNPTTNEEELWAVWRTSDETAFKRESSDQDIVLRRVLPTMGVYVYEVSPRLDTGDDTRPNLIAHGSRLYIIWQTDDMLSSHDSDEDIVMRYFDGEQLSEKIYSLSRSGDRNIKVVLDQEPHNLGDDEFPSVVIYRNRLYALWQTFDNVTGRPDDDPGKSNMRAIIMRLVVDADNDGDGVPDSNDMFPNDKNEWMDRDKDGVGDNADAYPDDPEKWKKIVVEDEENKISLSMEIIVSIAMISVILLIIGFLFIYRLKSHK